MDKRIYGVFVEGNQCDHANFRVGLQKYVQESNSISQENRTTSEVPFWMNLYNVNHAKMEDFY